MRVVVLEYANSDRVATLTSDDGSYFLAEWAGPKQVGPRVNAFVEVACDSTEEGIQRLQDLMAWLSREIDTRKSQLVKASAANGTPTKQAV